MNPDPFAEDVIQSNQGLNAAIRQANDRERRAVHHLITGERVPPQSAPDREPPAPADWLEAARSGDIGKLQQLLDSNLNPNAVDVIGESALHKAVRGNQPEAVRMLLAVTNKDHIWMAIHLAQHYHHSEVLSVLQEEHPEYF